MKRLFAWLCIILLVYLFVPCAFAESGAFLVMDGRTSQILEGENHDTKLPMASTTKIMTALVVLESVSLNESVEITAESVGVEGSSLYVKTGERYTVEQLLYALMLRSANDCAVALAIHCGGTVDAFVEMMNQRAYSIGLTNTHFKNPNGLPVNGHYTTAKELALIMLEAMKHPDFRSITGSKYYEINGQRIVNHNKLLSLYKDCIGGKTGYTVEAGRCLVTVAQRDGVPLICVTLGRRDDWNIHASAYDRWFSDIQDVVLAEKESLYFDLPIAGGGTVQAFNCNRVSVKMFDSNTTVDRIVKSGPFIYGNKVAGDVVGTVEFWCNGVRISESPLVLAQEVQVLVKKELFITRIFRFFRRIFLKNA